MRAMAEQGVLNVEWQAFNHSDYECGLFWLLVESPDVDIDAGNDGSTTGRHTGEVVRSTVLAMVEEDADGHPYFDAIDSANFGRIADDDVVTHFAEVKAPAIPAN
ncbi:hypothetical protein BIS09_12555 [Halomonas sp. R1t8]|uniref:hypothetical protein n=1 Tax=unclassified Halomonas TaxID=2609666 RepID=UPI00209C99A6|nr:MULTISPECIES: hypothetical protein [unclassified Halomonas]MCP1304665.1 hypothetical protein [Halomonas sp. R1t8]MCP1331085.1 hypothetical protein [Halomonas sp. R1t4]